MPTQTPLDTSTTLWLCGLIAVIGIASLIGIIYLAVYLFREKFARMFSEPHPFWDMWMHRLDKVGGRFDFDRMIIDLNNEFLARRNEFWTSYIQVIVALVIIIVLAILLITRTISAEAGLPILSAISGFAIAKGVAGGKGSSNQNRNE
jgi:hypothetical protein